MSQDPLTVAIRYHRQGDAPRAAKHYAIAIKQSPNNADAWHLAGVLQFQMRQLNEARRLIERAIRLNARKWQYHCDLGCVLERLSLYPEALAEHLAALQLGRDNPIAHNNLGSVQHKIGNEEDARKCFQLAIRLDPSYEDALCNLGHLARDQGRLDDASKWYGRALRYRPRSPKALANRGMLRVQTGDYAGGWDDYEYRWYENGGFAPRGRLWNGESLAGKTIWIRPEQGIGDEVMFASCYAEVIAAAGQCVISCAPRLQPLFAASFPSAIVVGGDNPPSQLKIDYEVYCGSLPRFLRRSATMFVRKAGYLSGNLVRTAYWRSYLGAALKIGIGWRAGTQPEQQRHRAAPLALWSALLQTSGVVFVNLQHGDTAQEVDEVMSQHGVNIISPSEINPTRELSDYASLVNAMDLVISVDNTVAHLGAALGKPVWALMPKFPGWRWGTDARRCPWYESVEMFRQVERFDWTAPLSLLANRIREFVARRRETGARCA